MVTKLLQMSDLFKVDKDLLVTGAVPGGTTGGDPGGSSRGDFYSTINFLIPAVLFEVNHHPLPQITL